MDSHPHDSEGFQNRLDDLEKQIRRFKQLGSAVLLGMTLLIVMGQNPAKKTVEANEFILKDATGKVRARMSMNSAFASPELVFLDENGKPRVEMRGGLIKGLGGNVSVFDTEGRERGAFESSLFGGVVSLIDLKGSPKTVLSEGDLTVSDGQGFKATLGAQHVTVLDDQGFESTLGVQHLVTPGTGETHKTSAASLVMFDKSKNVIWKAP